MQTNELLEIYAKILASYSNVVAQTCQKYNLNRTCFEILLFLKNHPQYDTARSISDIRGIKKSMASIAIEQLFQSGLITRCSDNSDHRIQHLKLTDKSKEITDLGQHLQCEFQNHLLSSLTEEEQHDYLAFSHKIMQSLHEMEEYTNHERNNQ